MNKKDKNFKSRNNTWKNKSGKDDSYSLNSGNHTARNGSKPKGNPYKVEGGYKASNAAGILPKAPSLGKGFGAASDVPSKLTFGKQSVVFQPGFVNDIRYNNVYNPDGDVVPAISYNRQVEASWPYMTADRSAGIMRVVLHDYLGANNNTEKSPLNLAAQLHKQYIDTALGEQLSFSSCDLGIYMGGVKSPWDCIYWIRRAINLSHNSKDRADYLTRGMYLAMRVCKEGHPVGSPDPSFEIAAKSARYLERLNASIKKLNTIPVPTNMSWLVTYTEDTYSNIYQDEPGESAQFYVCVPQGFYLYDETNQGTPEDPKYYNGASLKWTLYNQKAIDAGYNDGFVSIPEMLDLLEDMLARLATHTNSDYMAQKILNAYGTANTLQCPTFATNDDLVPILYDEDFLSALENAKIVPNLIHTDNWHDYTIDAAREMIIGRPIYKFYIGDPLADDVASSLVNLPLQFHRDPDQIDSHAVSNALRWHPYTGFIRTGHDSGGTADKLEIDFENNFGFQVVTRLSVIYMRDSGQHYAFDIYGHASLVKYLGAIQDFKTLPIGIVSDYTVANDYDAASLSRVSYTARRDVEVTIQGEDVANYFWSLAEMVWNVVDGQTSFGGQRNKIG